MANSLPSNTVTAIPAATVDTPTRPIPAIAVAMRDKLLVSANLLSWIQTYDALETTTGHVLLGYAPNTIKDLASKGPTAFVQVMTSDSGETISAKALLLDIELRVTIVWQIDQRLAQLFVAELNFLDAILNELVAVGLNFAGGVFGGNLLRFSGPTFSEIDPNSPEVRWAEFRFIIRMGMEEQ